TEDGKFVAITREKQGGDLSFWDVSDLANPKLAWSIQLPLSEAYCVHQVIIQGDRLYASWYQAGIWVYDISDRYNPVLLGSYDTFPGSVNGYDGAWGVYPVDDGRILGFDMQKGIFILTLNGSGTLPGPAVTYTSPSKPLLGTVDTVRVTFDRPVDVSTFTTDDVISFTDPNGDAIPITSAAVVPSSDDPHFALAVCPRAAR